MAHGLTTAGGAVRRTGIWNIWPGSRGSLCLDARELHHLAPLLGFLGNEPPKVGGRAWKHTKVGKPRLDLGIGKRGIHLLVEGVDDFGGRILRCAEARTRRSPRSRRGHGGERHL